MMTRGGRLSTFAAAAALSGALACVEAEKGQLMLALQTDMSIPEDVDTVRIEVLSFGAPLHAEDYPVGPDGAKIPATLGIVAGEDPSRPVTVRVIARQRGQLRTLREVVTTVPVQRLATLRMPIQWLCDDLATEDEGGVGTLCPERQTCLAGKCVDRVIDSTTLPDFRPEDVFGGAPEPGDGGRCLDTVACFAGGFSASVDPADCSIEMPPDGGEGVNVALVTAPGGGGICGQGFCLVPLDARSEAGWQEEGGRILLPEAACRRLESGRVRAVAVTTACESKTESIPTCGPWSSVTGQPGTFDGRPPSGLDPDAGPEPIADAGAPDASEPDDDAGSIELDAGPVEAGAEAGPPDAAVPIASAEIGPEGGTLTSPDGVLTVIVPPGAVTTPFTLTIGPAGSAPSGHLGPAYVLGPDGQAFLIPVQVHYDPTGVDLGGASPGALRVATAGADGWELLEPLDLDGLAGTVVGLAPHFSVFGLVEGRCVERTVEASPLKSALYLMIDASASMGEGGAVTAFGEVQSAIDEFATRLATDDTRIAAHVFGGELACDGSSLATPAVPMAPVASNAAAVDAFLDGVTPGGVAPMEAALNGLVRYLETYSAGFPREAAAGVLISRGAPGGACSGPFDGDSEAEAAHLVSIVEGSPRPIYVMDYGSTENDLLSVLAEAGGTGDPRYAPGYLHWELESVHYELADCSFELPAGVYDPELLEVTLVDGVERFPLSRQTPEPDGTCGEIGEGYVLVADAAPPRVRLCWAECDILRESPNATVEYAVRCGAGGAGGADAGGAGDDEGPSVPEPPER